MTDGQKQILLQEYEETERVKQARLTELYTALSAYQDARDAHETAQAAFRQASDAHFQKQLQLVRYGILELPERQKSEAA